MVIFNLLPAIEKALKMRGVQDLKSIQGSSVSIFKTAYRDNEYTIFGPAIGILSDSGKNHQEGWRFQFLTSQLDLHQSIGSIP